MFTLSLNDLLDYTDWLRQKWQQFFHQHGDEALKLSCGEHGDGRFQTAGDVLRHIFSAETRYVDRLSGRLLTDTSTIPTGSAEALFDFGARSRAELKRFVESYPVESWDVLQEFNIMNTPFTASPKKIIMHTVMHEVRHWAQLATLFRLNGCKVEFQDFLASPVFGGEIRREKVKAS